MTSMLEAGRNLAAAAMAHVFVDTCTVVRPVDGKGTLGGTSGYTVIPPTPTAVYDGPCIATGTAGGTIDDEGEGEEGSSRVRVRLPATAPMVKHGDIVTMTAVASLGGTFAGDVLKVVRGLTSSVGTSRFAVCERIEQAPTAGSAAV